MAQQPRGRKPIISLVQLGCARCCALHFCQLSSAGCCAFLVAVVFVPSPPFVGCSAVVHSFLPSQFLPSFLPSCGRKQLLHTHDTVLEYSSTSFFTSSSSFSYRYARSFVFTFRACVCVCLLLSRTNVTIHPSTPWVCLAFYSDSLTTYMSRNPLAEVLVQCGGGVVNEEQNVGAGKG